MDKAWVKEAVRACETIGDAKSLLAECVKGSAFVSLHTKYGTYEDVSDTFQDLTGYSLKDVEGESAYSLFHPDDVKEVLKSHAYVTLKSEISKVTIRFRKPNGDYVKLKSYSRQLQGKDNNGMIVVFSYVKD
jgi:two-component system, LuxR family, sensor kinase FixL